MAGKTSSAQIHVGAQKATIAEKGTESLSKLPNHDERTSPDGDEKKNVDEDVSYKVASGSKDPGPIYYTEKKLIICQEGQNPTPDEKLQIHQKFATLSVSSKPTSSVLDTDSEDSLASMVTTESGEAVSTKEDETQAMSNSDEASASFVAAKIEPFAENQEAVEAPSREIYVSSSESLVKYDPSEWETDGPTFHSFADEQCHNSPDQFRRVEQGIIYNKEICPSSQEYRKGTEWHVQVDECLGSGTFGEVYKCRTSLTGGFYAVKKVPRGRVRLDEIRLWQKLGRHPNVCELYAVTFEEDFFWFHMELVLFADQPAQNLPAYVKTLSVQIPLPGLLKAGCGLFEGLGHMHKQHSTHRDLGNSKNIMVGTGLQFKIIDFSFIRAVTEDKYYDKDLKGGLACFFLLVTRQKKDPDKWTEKAVEDCVKDHADANMLLPLCQTLISLLEYEKGDAMKVAGWMAEEINRRLANLVPEVPANPES